MQKDGIGTLYVVATPIGNLDDLTFRAAATLKQVDRIAAEDTRHSGALLKHYSIAKPMVSLHNFNEKERLQSILGYLAEGESIALISDAGTPLISDPGFHLVNAVRAAGHKVVPVPGACAAIAALSAAGLPTDKFSFEGFLPAKAEARRQQLKSLLSETRTLVFYEAPHRLLDALQSMVDVFGGDRLAVVARELTKHYESFLHQPLSTLLAYYETHADECRGEIVMLISGANISTDDETTAALPTLTILLEELPLKQAVALTAKITGARKNELYEKALTMKQKPDAADTGR